VFIGRIVSNRIVRSPNFLTLGRKEKDYELFTIHEKAGCRSCNCDSVCLQHKLGTSPCSNGNTDKILKQNKQNLDREHLNILLDRSEVRKQLEAWGVKSEEAKAWIDSLTDQEIAEIVARIDQMPAGGSAIGILMGGALLVFFVLLVTDILGYTDVFPFVKGQ